VAAGGVGGRGERMGGMGQITAHGNPHSSFSLSFFPLCVQRGFDEKILHLAVQYTLHDYTFKRHDYNVKGHEYNVKQHDYYVMWHDYTVKQHN
jgi:hypothetical protein